MSMYKTRNGYYKDNNSRYTTEYIDYLSGGMNEISDSQRGPLARALSVLDNDLIDKIIEEICFVSSNPTCLAFHLPLNAKHLQRQKAMIFLSEKLFTLDEKEITRTILHEVAHHILNHKCLFDFDYDDLDKKDLQEKEADILAEKLLRGKKITGR